MDKKTLDNNYNRANELYAQAFSVLNGYLDDAIAFSGGAVELKDFHRTHKEAEAAGIEFDDQFPVTVTVFDRHDFVHDIYVTRLYKDGNLFHVDGYDRTDGEWVQHWYTSGDFETLSSLGDFVNGVLNPSEEDSSSGVVPGDSVLVGYTLVDDDNCYPCQLGCWDVFRTEDDAAAYRDNVLEQGIFHVTEVRDSNPARDLSMYRYHGGRAR